MFIHSNNRKGSLANAIVGSLANAIADAGPGTETAHLWWMVTYQPSRLSPVK